MNFYERLERILGVSEEGSSGNRRAQSRERGNMVGHTVADRLETTARRKIEKGQNGGDDRLKEEGIAMLKVAEEIRQGGEAALLAAMGVLGRDED